MIYEFRLFDCLTIANSRVGIDLIPISYNIPFHRTHHSVPQGVAQRMLDYILSFINCGKAKRLADQQLKVSGCLAV